ncbi:hypothetical protein Q427_11470 [Halomonas sp. BC04]|nr:hypothetical protein Q427_11470 [Halomonas sp. BC04]
MVIATHSLFLLKELELLARDVQAPRRSSATLPW